MKTLISICSAVGLITTLSVTAEANVDTCVGSLLEVPVQHSQERLRLSTWQVRRLEAIQRDTSHRRVRLQRQLDQVQQELDQLRRAPYDPMALGRLERQQGALAGRLERITARASNQALMLLSPWQRRRCERRRPPRVAVLEPPPPTGLVVVRHPRPGVLKRVRIRHGSPKHVYHKPPRERRRRGKRVVVHRAPPAPEPAPPRRLRRHRR